MTLYFECHITIEPVFDDELDHVKQIASRYKFRVADLLMKKDREATETRSEKDTFMTSHSQDLLDMKERMICAVKDLRVNGYKVWRYKIEDIVIDSRKDEVYKLL